MNEDIAKGNWKQIKGRLKSHWGELTEDDLTEAEGNLDYLVGRVQSEYGLAKDEIRAKLREFGLSN
jgi:uncharacterized protein YjbJ (UPF0337 family)